MFCVAVMKCKGCNNCSLLPSCFDVRGVLMTINCPRPSLSYLCFKAQDISFIHAPGTFCWFAKLTKLCSGVGVKFMHADIKYLQAQVASVPH